MRQHWIHFGMTLIAVGATVFTCKARRTASIQEIFNGKDEGGFPSVVMYYSISPEGPVYSCTGTFLSPTVMLTAAHCVTSNNKTHSVRYESTSISATEIFVHPKWNELSNSQGAADQDTSMRYDLALMRFPAATFRGSESFKLLTRAPQAEDGLTIVGYGANKADILPKICVMRQRPIGSKCRLSLVKDDTTGFGVSDLVTWDSQVECKLDDAKRAWLAIEANKDKNFETFIKDSCGTKANGEANINDRAFEQSGGGRQKRSGTNKVGSVGNGLIYFEGVISAKGDGVEAASGGGDSGGPLFIKEGDEYFLAGVTHGGHIAKTSGTWRKHSVYVDLNSDTSLPWLKKTVEDNRLDAPQFRSNVGGGSVAGGNPAGGNVSGGSVSGGGNAAGGGGAGGGVVMPPSANRCTCGSENNFGSVPNGVMVSHWCVLRRADRSLVGFTDRSRQPVGGRFDDCSQDCPTLVRQFANQCGAFQGGAVGGASVGGGAAAGVGGGTAGGGAVSGNVNAGEKCQCGIWTTIYGRTCAVVRPRSQWGGVPSQKFLVQSGSNASCTTEQLCQINYREYLLSPSWCPQGFIMGNQ